MRDGWQEVRIGDICTLTKGLTPTQKAVPGQYPLIVTAEIPLSSNEYQFDGEAVCVPMVSSTGHGHASLKRVHYANGQFAVANIITALQAKPGTDVDMRFLWLLLDHWRDEIIVPLMKGTANVSLSQKSLAEARIHLPPLAEQQRIADLVGALDDAIGAAEVSQRACEDVLKALRASLFDGLTEWPVRTIAEVAMTATGKAFPARFQGRSEGDFPYVKCSDMSTEGNERLVATAANWVDGDSQSELRARVMPAGTVIFPILGAALSTEKRRILDVPAAYDQNVMGLVPGPEITTEFLFHFMNRVRLSEFAQHGAVPSVNQSIVGSIQLRVPSLELQKHLSDDLDAAENSALLFGQTANSMRILRTDLLTDLLSGEHQIPASYDELLDGVEVPALV